MIAPLLIVFGSLFGESSISLGKKTISKHQETKYQYGILHLFYALIFFIISVVIFKSPLVFSFLSFPTLIAKLVIEILQMEFTLRAVVKTERSTFNFVRLLTIPFLLVVDIFLGYPILSSQMFGTLIVFISLGFLIYQPQFNKKGLIWVLMSALNAVLTTSLYKYNITNYNSVAAEQLITLPILLIYLLVGMKTREHRKIKSLFKPVLQLQAVMFGIASVLIGFSFMFAPSSIILTMERTFNLIWGIIFGNIYFHEKGLKIKIIASIAMIIGLILTTSTLFS